LRQPDLRRPGCRPSEAKEGQEGGVHVVEEAKAGNQGPRGQGPVPRQPRRNKRHGRKVRQARRDDGLEYRSSQGQTLKRVAFSHSSSTVRTTHAHPPAISREWRHVVWVGPICCVSSVVDRQDSYASSPSFTTSSLGSCHSITYTQRPEDGRLQKKDAARNQGTQRQRGGASGRAQQEAIRREARSARHDLEFLEAGTGEEEGPECSAD